jgi:hypothetical protein
MYSKKPYVSSLLWLFNLWSNRGFNCVYHALEPKNRNQRALLAVEKNRRLKKLFWNSEWQSQQGIKRSIKAKTNNLLFYNAKWQSIQAKKAGLKNTKKQQQARQIVGKSLGLTYGFQNGLNRQGNQLKQMLSKETVWVYSSEMTSFCLRVAPQTSFSALVDILQSYTPTIIRKSSFYQVIHGTRPQMYGWRLFFIKLELIDKVICSRASSTEVEGSETTGEVETVLTTAQSPLNDQI